MKTCYACRELIDTHATKCPRCQTIFDGGEMEKGRKESGRRLIARMAFVVLAIFVAGYWLNHGGAESLGTAMSRLD